MSDAALVRALAGKLLALGSSSVKNTTNLTPQKGHGSSTSMKTTNLEQLAKVVQQMGRKDVLVGIPRENAARKDGEQMNNAARAYILDRGSPAAHIPARPFLEPGVQDAMPRATAYMKQGTLKALKGDMSALDRGLTAAGIAAETAVRKRINSNLPPPLSPFTVMWRHRDRGGGRMRKSEVTYGALVNIGYTPAQAQAATGIKSLVNTGEMRNAVTHVLRTK